MNSYFVEGTSNCINDIASSMLKWALPSLMKAEEYMRAEVSTDSMVLWSPDTFQFDASSAKNCEGVWAVASHP